jgi:D-xylulose reductase
MTVPIPENVSWEEAGAIQPLSIAVQLARRASFNIGQTVVIFGCGPLGLLILAVAKARGVKTIVCFDIEESRVNFAKKYGADAGIISPSMTPAQKEDPLTFTQEYASRIFREQEVGHGFDVSIEASGAEICAQMAISMLKPGGTCECLSFHKFPETPLLTVIYQFTRYPSRSWQVAYQHSVIRSHRQGTEYKG